MMAAAVAFAQEKSVVRRGDQAMGFLCRIFADYRKCDLAGLDVFQTFAAGNQFAVGWEDGRDANDVARRDSSVSERQLKARQPFTMFSDAFGKEDFLRDERHSAGVWCLREWAAYKIFRCGKVTVWFCRVNAFSPLLCGGEGR